MLSSSNLLWKVERFSLVSGRTAERRILVSAARRTIPEGSRESADQDEPGKIAGTNGKPQERSNGESGPEGARGMSKSQHFIPGNLGS